MAITRTAMVDDDGSGTTGTVINNAWKQELYDQIDGLVVPIGTWINTPFSAADYSASGAMTWTVEAGDVIFDTYCLIGKSMFWSFDLNATAIGGTAGTQLRKKLPAGLVPASNVLFPIWVANPTGTVSMGNVNAASRWLELYPTPTLSVAWTLGAARVAANVLFQIA